MSKPAAPRPLQPTKRKLSELFLDPGNPRLSGYNFKIADQFEICEVLWRRLAVDEIVDSMLANGYWRHEFLYAAEEDGKCVVIEGNRRLAAAKIITDKEWRDRLAPKIEKPRSDVLESLKELEVYICTRDELWQFIAFKHVNGPQDWDSIAKAEFIVRVRAEQKVDLAKIAASIGDRHETVKRLYRGFVVLRQAEEHCGFSRDDSYLSSFPFSHLWTALGYAHIQKFLGMKSAAWGEEAPVPKTHYGQLKELCKWLFGSKKESRPSAIVRQNPGLRILDEVVGTKTGLDALRSGLPLGQCQKRAHGDHRLLSDALTAAELKLREACGYVATGYSGDEENSLKATNILKLARKLQEDIEEICNRSGDAGKKKR